MDFSVTDFGCQKLYRSPINRPSEEGRDIVRKILRTVYVQFYVQFSKKEAIFYDKLRYFPDAAIQTERHWRSVCILT